MGQVRVGLGFGFGLEPVVLSWCEYLLAALATVFRCGAWMRSICSGPRRSQRSHVLVDGGVEGEHTSTRSVAPG